MTSLLLLMDAILVVAAEGGQWRLLCATQKLALVLRAWTGRDEAGPEVGQAAVSVLAAIAGRSTTMENRIEGESWFCVTVGDTGLRWTGLDWTRLMKTVVAAGGHEGGCGCGCGRTVMMTVAPVDC